MRIVCFFLGHKKFESRLWMWSGNMYQEWACERCNWHDFWLTTKEFNTADE